ncbi:hypothetical protein ACJX0J_008994, partial [Zea mays]
NLILSFYSKISLCAHLMHLPLIYLLLHNFTCLVSTWLAATLIKKSNAILAKLEEYQHLRPIDYKILFHNKYNNTYLKLTTQNYFHIYKF